MKRRAFLFGGIGAAAGALLVGWTVLPVRQRLTPSGPLPVEATQVALNGWVKIAADDSVTVMMCRSEMGQGVHTGLAMILAEELDADWARVRVENAPPDRIYNNIQVVVDGLPFHPDDHGVIRRIADHVTRKLMREIGEVVTGGSSGLNDLWMPMREAGASARAMLVAAAAERWRVPAAECSVARGKVLHASGKSATFGELAAAAGRQRLPGSVPLKDPSAFRLIGQPLHRLDAEAKTNGSARFGIDALPEQLLYASVLMCPTVGGRVKHADVSAATTRRGVVKAFVVPPFNGGTGGVAVVADNAFRAMKALEALKVDWEPGPASGLSSQDMMARIGGTLDQHEGHAYYSHGDVDAALSKAAKVVSAEYSAPWLAHGAVEPINCTVHCRDDGATVWVSTQVPGIAREQAAKVLGLPAHKVDVQVMMLGGGFGRRLEADFISQAAAIAREVKGRPVQTIWTRAQDMTHDFYRPACVARLRAGIDGHGKLVGWHARSAGQAVVPEMLARDFGFPRIPLDKTAVEGAFDQPYAWPAARISHAIVDLPIPVGFWRSVGHSHQAFFTECFLDEMAVAAGKDPVAFRASLLGTHPRHLAVLQRVAMLADWGKPAGRAADGARRARGVALHQSYGSIVGQVAEVSVARDKTIRVHRVVCVIDCGMPVNPNLIRQQAESGIVFGLSAALYQEITFVDGVVKQQNFHDFPVVRIAECPVIETDIIASPEAPQGAGEVCVPPVAPAVANALFALTGQRLRALPLKLA
ncbi:isoquinoline 1-oxidoreductase, beta subunit [Cupriavidus sp. YR651]|uniref:xanthine dehydrogenase family protein molybdopterin-binding subunit n=1 Tax=Cupriavidus sp. YR651 TaxID=1855315 RepID=UPI0008896B9C|nr:molybdopterin cofactor-binding domain-containing protein [Cupriavidus sp. YR651]SDD45175.1 isoquinoline 1-oxidoreductase, beta subunit [Cupriavidus sp. YR651]